MACTFFFSYSRHDSDIYLDRFFKDLVQELRSLTGRHEEDLVFRDTSGIKVGEQWPEKIASALSSCRIFLSVHSPAYFGCDFCDKEWTAFQNRLEEYATQTFRPVPSLVVPIHWIPLPPGYQKLPKTITAIQRSHSELGDLYAKEGLHYLMRLYKIKQYREVIRRLAIRLIELEVSHQDLRPADHLIDFSAMESSFNTTAETMSEYHADRGVRHVQFAVVAGRRNELKHLRQVVECYGSEAVDWCPYHPTVTRRIGAIVQHIASEQNLTSEFLPVDSDLSERMARARRSNNVVIFIVDPWTVGLDKYRRCVQVYDREHHHHCVLLIPWPDDQETGNNRARLEEVVRLAFVTKATAKDPNAFRDEIDSPECLEAELRNSILHATAQIIRAAEFVRRAEADHIFLKPWLAGPGGLSS